MSKAKTLYFRKIECQTDFLRLSFEVLSILSVDFDTSFSCIASVPCSDFFDGFSANNFDGTIKIIERVPLEFV